MSVNPSGGFNLSSNLAFAVQAGGNILNNYTVPIQPTHQTNYGPGTGPNQINKGAQQGGIASASPATADLTAIVCVDGTTGFAHVREFAVYNDATNDSFVLKLDFSVSNAWDPFIEGTAVKIDIPAGGVFRLPKPIGTNGWTVDSTHKAISLDPGANNVPYRLVVAGD